MEMFAEEIPPRLDLQFGKLREGPERFANAAPSNFKPARRRLVVGGLDLRRHVGSVGVSSATAGQFGEASHVHIQSPEGLPLVIGFSNWRWSFFYPFF